MADILHKIDIDATPDKVYSAVSSNQVSKNWCTTDVSGDYKKGSILNYLAKIVATLSHSKCMLMN